MRGEGRLRDEMLPGERRRGGLLPKRIFSASDYPTFVSSQEALVLRFGTSTLDSFNLNLQLQDSLWLQGFKHLISLCLPSLPWDTRLVFLMDD